MEAKINQTYPAGHERAAAMLATCKRAEEAQVRTPYTDSEILEMRRQLSEVAAKLHKKEAELSRISKELRGEMAPLVESVYDLAKRVDLGYSESLQDVFLYADYEEGMMFTYDRNGELLSSRRLLPEERQTTVIEMAGKTGTND